MTGIQTNPDPWPYCPDCGAKMKLVRPKSGQDWEPFWGRTEYRYGCRGTRQIDSDGAPYYDERPPVLR